MDASKSDSPAVPFPEPHLHIGIRPFWRLGDLRKWERQLRGEDEGVAVARDDDEHYLASAHVARRYNVSPVTIWRWRRDVKTLSEQKVDAGEAA